MREQDFNAAQINKIVEIVKTEADQAPQAVTLESVSRELALYRPFLESLRTGTVLAKLTLSGTQSVTAAAKVLLDSKDFQAGDITVDLTNHRVTVHRQGYYLITGCVYFTTSTDLKNYKGFIYLNGASIASASASPGATGDSIYLPIVTTVQLVGGDDIELYAQASVATLVGATTFLSIIKL